MKTKKRERVRLEKPEIRVKDGEESFEVSAFLKDKSVSRMGVWDMTWRIGCTTVRMGGVGGVETIREYRNKGYSRMCMDRAVLEMRRRGFEMAALFGISNYYHRWGFASAMPDYRLRIATRLLEESKMPRGMRARPFDRKRDAAGVLSIYARNNACRSASQVRPGARKWRSFRRGSTWFTGVEAFVVQDRRGRIAGYVCHDKSATEMIVSEVGYAGPEVFPALAAEIARRAVAKRTGEVSFCVPPDHLFASYLKKWDCREEAFFAKGGGGMARIITLEPTLKKCAREFAERIRRSALRGRSFGLGLVTDIGSATIVSRRGRIFIMPGARDGVRMRISQRALAQLLLGYRDVPAVGLDAGVRIPPRAQSIAEALFPRGCPYMWGTDQF